MQARQENQAKNKDGGFTQESRHAQNRPELLHGCNDEIIVGARLAKSTTNDQFELPAGCSEVLKGHKETEKRC